MGLYYFLFTTKKQEYKTRACDWEKIHRRYVVEEISNQTLINLMSEQTEHLVELKKLNKEDYSLDKFIQELRSELIYRLQIQRPSVHDFVGGKL